MQALERHSAFLNEWPLNPKVFFVFYEHARVRRVQDVNCHQHSMHTLYAHSPYLFHSRKRNRRNNKQLDKVATIDTCKQVHFFSYKF